MRKEEKFVAQHDIEEEDLLWSIHNSDTPDLLKALVSISRVSFGFFNRTISRSFEYPFIATGIKSIKNKKILDIGAGLSPLPIFLAQKGAKVVTVDNSTTARIPGVKQEDWNGWGFFNYELLSTNIISVNKDVTEISFDNYTFDCAYSVSVIEHMPASNRRKLWNKLKHWLKKEGALILTADLIPQTNFLWNYCEGNLVEPEESHGDLDSLTTELCSAGFVLLEKKVLRNLPSSRTDCTFLHYLKN